MNWKKIEKDYPNAFFKLGEWLRPINEEISDENREIFEGFRQSDIRGDLYGDWQHCQISVRDLYDFFDDNYIRCHYSFSGDLYLLYFDGFFREILVTDIKTGENKWMIHNNWITSNNQSVKIKNRIEAEHILFTKAFEILEEQLKKK